MRLSLRVIRKDQPQKFAMDDAGPEQDVGAANADLASASSYLLHYKHS